MRREVEAKTRLESRASCVALGGLSLSPRRPCYGFLARAATGFFFEPVIKSEREKSKRLSEMRENEWRTKRNLISRISSCFLDLSIWFVSVLYKSQEWYWEIIVNSFTFFSLGATPEYVNEYRIGKPMKKTATLAALMLRSVHLLLHRLRENISRYMSSFCSTAVFDQPWPIRAWNWLCSGNNTIIIVYN